jgi:hypothetical protein
MFFTALSRCQVKFTAMQGTNNFAVTDHAFRQMPLTVWAPVPNGGELSITQTKNRDFLAACNKTTAVANAI